MENFFTDNDDIRFLFDHLDMHRLAGLMEEGFRFAREFDAAPADADEAVEIYRSILTEVGDVAANLIAPASTETDEVGNVLNDDNTVTYAPAVTRAIKAFGDSGLMGCTLPHKYGGRNCPCLMLSMTNDIIARADAAMMLQYGLQGIAETINSYASDDIKDEFLPDMAAGRKTGAMVLTEPEAGSDLQSAKVVAYQDDDGNWFIRGLKRFITNGCGHVLLVMARSEPEIHDGRGLSLFLVERGPKVQVRRLENKLGIHGSPTCELYFDDAPGRLIGERQQGLIRYVMALMYGARIAIAAQACGIGEAAFRLARSYASTRKQFGTEINTFPPVRELLVESSVDVQAARALTYYASYCVDLSVGAEKRMEAGNFADDAEKKQAKNEARTRKKIAGMLTPMCKYYASEMSMRVSNHGIAVMGGNGYMHDYKMEQYLRDSRITTIYEGTTQLQIVPSISSICSGTAEVLVNELLDREWPAEIAPLVAQIRDGLKDLAEAVACIKDDPDANYRRLYARKAVDMAVYLIIAALFCDHATASEQKLAVAKYWLTTRMPELKKNKQMILSGDRTILTEFEALAGAAPVMA